MAAKLISFNDFLDAAFTITAELSLLTNRQLPLKLSTDRKSMFDIISKGSSTS